MSRLRTAYRRRDDYMIAIERTLKQLGITDFKFERRANNHRAVRIRHAGKERFVPFPSSGRNWFGPKNAAGDVRRAIRQMEKDHVS
jgi:hypothetical protein